MTTHTVYLSSGSNLGNRLANLQAAAATLEPAITLTSLSPVFETQPWGYTDQPAYLNQALAGTTELSPVLLLNFLKQAELRLGRQPSFRYGPRLIDLDILFYNDSVLSSPGLTIPHPHLHERAFVLVPLATIAPDLRHPILGKTVSELLARVDASGVTPYISPPNPTDL